MEEFEAICKGYTSGKFKEEELAPSEEEILDSIIEEENDNE